MTTNKVLYTGFGLIWLGLIYVALGCQPSPKHGEAQTEGDQNSTVYDSVLAKKLGADDYGMKLYVMAFLRRGPNRTQDSVKAANLQRAHLDNIQRLAEEGRLVLAGPFGGDGEIRGIYIFDVPTVDEARKLTETDPAIQAGSLEMELIPWYGTAVLPMVNEWYEKVAKIKI